MVTSQAMGGKADLPAHAQTEEETAMWPAIEQLVEYAAIGLAVYVLVVAYIAKRQRQSVLARLQKLAISKPTFEQTCWAVDEQLRRGFNWFALAVGFPAVFFVCLLAWPLVMVLGAVWAVVAWSRTSRRHR
jgi:hypothetical protein